MIKGRLLEALRGWVLGNGESSVASRVRSNASGQALACALHVALAGRSNSVIGVHMRALAEASVHAVESALDRDMHILLVNLAISSSVLRVAHACSVVAPSRVSAVVGASSDAAVLSSESGLAPAGSVEAETIVGAVAQANGDRAVRSMEHGVAHAGSIVAISVEVAVRGANLDGAVKVSPARGADASVVDALTSGQAVVGAGRH